VKGKISEKNCWLPEADCVGEWGYAICSYHMGSNGNQDEQMEYSHVLNQGAISCFFIQPEQWLW
jgi:hypothetical protein